MVSANDLDYVSCEKIENNNCSILKIYMQTHNTFGQFNVKYRYVFIYKTVKKEDNLFHYEKCIDDFATEKMDENDIRDHKRVTKQLLQKLPEDVRRQYGLRLIFT